MVDDPNVFLSQALVGLTVVQTTVLVVSTTTSRWIENILFVVTNADAASMSASFWIEMVQDPNGGTFLQLQYIQTVLRNFVGLSWPHVFVANLVKVF